MVRSTPFGNLKMREILEITTTGAQAVAAGYGTERVFKIDCFVADNHNHA